MLQLRRSCTCLIYLLVSSPPLLTYYIRRASERFHQSVCVVCLCSRARAQSTDPTLAFSCLAPCQPRLVSFVCRLLDLWCSEAPCRGVAPGPKAFVIHQDQLGCRLLITYTDICRQSGADDGGWEERVMTRKLCFGLQWCGEQSCRYEEGGRRGSWCGCGCGCVHLSA